MSNKDAQSILQKVIKIEFQANIHRLIKKIYFEFLFQCHSVKIFQWILIFLYVKLRDEYVHVIILFAIIVQVCLWTLLLLFFLFMFPFSWKYFFDKSHEPWMKTIWSDATLGVFFFFVLLPCMSSPISVPFSPIILYLI